MNWMWRQMIVSIHTCYHFKGLGIDPWDDHLHVCLFCHIYQMILEEKLSITKVWRIVNIDSAQQIDFVAAHTFIRQISKNKSQ